MSGGKIEDSWWRNILDRAGQTYVAPDVLQRDDLQSWLQDHQAKADFKVLVGARIAERPAAEEVRSRLRDRYAAVTQEQAYLADEPIEVVVAILLAAFVAELGPMGERLAWLTQENHSQTRAQMGQGFEDVTRKLENLRPNRLVEEVHTKLVNEELARIQQRRAWDPDRAREEVRILVERVRGGDLRHADRTARSAVLHWAARLHLGQPEQVEESKNFREQLKQLDPSADTRLVDALILEAEGDGDGALRMLRDAADPDARGAFFLILRRVKGQTAALEWFEAQEGRHHPGFLTGFGWSKVAAVLAEAERWNDAAAGLLAITEHFEEWPDLLFVEGTVNAALLLPSELRRHALDMNLLHPEVHILEGPDADRHHERATLCFRKAEERMLEPFPERASGARRWLLWLRLTHPDRAVQHAARDEVREKMKDPEQAIFMLPVARAFGIPFEPERLRSRLDQRSQLGGLEEHELQARFMLAEMSLEPADFIEFLVHEEPMLLRVLPPGLLSGARIEAFVKDGQAAKARSLLEERCERFEENDRQRLEALIEANEGKDPRPRLERLYESSHELIDLQNLIHRLQEVRDWPALRPHLEELFRRERTLQNALRLVHCMQNDPESDEVDILAFLEANPDLVDRNPDLISAKAWAQFRVGRLDEARTLNDRLLSERNQASDLQLDLNLALQSGAWEKFSGIVDREWPKRDEHEPETLIRLASLAAEADSTASRAAELIQLAVDKGGNDPHILTSAIDISYRLGREGKQLGEWLSRAIAISSNEGPARAFDMRTLVEEWMPAERARRRSIEEQWFHGELPLHVAATQLNVPLFYLLMGLPRSNAHVQDGRRRTLIPIVSGARRNVVIQPEWTIALDVTSLMVLSNLGFLEKAIARFRRVVLASDTMLLLLNERNRVRFHQPSLVKRAQEILAVIGTGQLRPEEPLPSPPKWLSEEVGIDFAQLLQAARQTQGRVVRPRPVHRLRSHLNEEAQLKEYDGLVLSAVRLEQILYQRGHLDVGTHEAAARYLATQDRGADADTEVSLERPLYFDDLAVTYLQSAGLLSVLANSGLDLRVHPSLRQEQIELIARHREGERLSEEIESIRLTLRDALQAGKAEFLPRHNPSKDEEERLLHAASTLSQFVQDAGLYDALLIDDRYINENYALTDLKGKTTPTLCVLDVLHYLWTQDALTSETRQHALYRLRQSGFFFVPVEAEELKRLLLSVQWKEDGTFVESAELRVIRQALARIRSLGMLRRSGENLFLVSLGYVSSWVITQLWTDGELNVDWAALLTDWVWRHVAPSPMDWHEDRSDEALANFLGLLLQSLPIMIREERREKFLAWMEGAVLKPLAPANSDVLTRLAALAGLQIERWSERIAEESHASSGDETPPQYPAADDSPATSE